jgi:VanZ family protein
MALIFFFSHQPDLSSGLGVWDTIGRKAIHAAEYALLCFLWWRALATSAPSGRALAAAAAISLGYAITDEFHQSFIQGRHGSPLDVLVDSVGIAAACLWVRRRDE